MAIYHASIKSFSRGKGESSIAAAAYRAGIDLVDTKTRRLHRYSLRKGVVEHFMLAPAGAPSWCSDARVFWDANEAWETRQNARVARELEVSLPSELSPDQRKTLALELGQLLVDRYKAVVLVAIHQPSQQGDNRNHHVHLLMSAREIGPDGFGVRAGAEFDARGGRGAEEVRLVRELVSQTINASLAAAGIEDRVDHRSLKDQARAAEAVGDFERAAELSRPPTKHIGKAITAALRREAVDPTLDRPGAAPSAAQAAMDEAVERFRQQGRLVATPAQHSHSSAMAERIAARRANPPKNTAVVWEKLGRPTRAGQPSYTALRLGRLGRITRSQGGNGADVLNAEAELVEQWLSAQTAAAEAALESVQEIPGVRLEPVFVDALASLRTRRVAVYGAKPSLFEDTEALSSAIQSYAAELRRPHDKRQRLAKAMARVSEAENPADPVSKEEILRARRELFKAKSAVSRPALIECERRINQARDLMKDARDGIERDFHITKAGPIEPDPFGPFPPETGGQRQSESNKRELKPRSSMQPRH